MLVLDCTLRDGGYYNDWNFPLDITNNYLEAMSAAGVDIVELGLRSVINTGFKGASAYTTDNLNRPYMHKVQKISGIDIDEYEDYQMAIAMKAFYDEF